MTDIKDLVFETDHYWVKRVPTGFEVYKTGLTHSTRVAIIGYTGDKGLQRAKLETARREASEQQHATKISHHATKKSPAQLQREINETLAGTDIKPISESSYLGGLRHKTESYGPGGTHTFTAADLPRREAKGLKLSENQKTMLRMALDTGRMSSGRYGWNEMHVRALEKKGLVTLASKATWDKEWKLTDLGRATAKTLHAEWMAEHAK
jgi:hypothetical protein